MKANTIFVSNNIHDLLFQNAGPGVQNLRMHQHFHNSVTMKDINFRFCKVYEHY